MKPTKATKQKITLYQHPTIDLDMIARNTFGIIKQYSKDKELFSNIVHITNKLKDAAAFSGVESRKG